MVCHGNPNLLGPQVLVEGTTRWSVIEGAVLGFLVSGWFGIADHVVYFLHGEFMLFEEVLIVKLLDDLDST